MLYLPHGIWLGLWAIAAFVVSFVNWFAVLFTTRSPDWIYRFLSAYLRYMIHVYSYLYLVADPFPGFGGEPGVYPIDPVIPPSAPQNRWKTFFRFILGYPASILAGMLSFSIYAVAIGGWFVSLITGRMPLGLRNLGVYILRYQAQTQAYATLLLTDRYPYSGPIERDITELPPQSVAQ